MEEMKEKQTKRVIRWIREKPGEKEAPGLIIRGVFYRGLYETSYIVRVRERKRRYSELNKITPYIAIYITTYKITFELPIYRRVNLNQFLSDIFL